MGLPRVLPRTILWGRSKHPCAKLLARCLTRPLGETQPPEPPSPQLSRGCVTAAASAHTSVKRANAGKAPGSVPGTKQGLCQWRPVSGSSTKRWVGNRGARECEFCTSVGPRACRIACICVLLQTLFPGNGGKKIKSPLPNQFKNARYTGTGVMGRALTLTWSGKTPAPRKGADTQLEDAGNSGQEESLGMGGVHPVQPPPALPVPSAIVN